MYAKGKDPVERKQFVKQIEKGEKGEKAWSNVLKEIKVGGIQGIEEVVGLGRTVNHSAGTFRKAQYHSI